jgi:hypothetical protein
VCVSVAPHKIEAWLSSWSWLWFVQYSTPLRTVSEFGGSLFYKDSLGKSIPIPYSFSTFSFSKMSKKLAAMLASQNGMLMLECNHLSYVLTYDDGVISQLDRHPKYLLERYDYLTRFAGASVIGRLLLGDSGAIFSAGPSTSSFTASSRTCTSSRPSSCPTRT